MREIRLRRIPAAAIPLSIVLTIALACGRSSHDVVPNSAAHILLFVGSGTSPNDVVAFERILTDGGFGYSTATSRELDGLSDSELRAYRLLVVPGGNFKEIGNGLAPTTTVRIRSAIGNEFEE